MGNCCFDDRISVSEDVKLFYREKVSIMLVIDTKTNKNYLIGYMCIDSIYERQTEMIHDEMNRPEICECAWCEDFFPESIVLMSEFFPSKDFCSDDCIEEYEKTHQVDE